MDELLHSFEALGTVEGITACLTLVILEIVLGIDNLVFISIIVGKAPQKDQRKIRLLGLVLAMVFRIVLLMMVGYIIQLKTPVWEPFGHPFSWKDLILLAGGMFLLAKSTSEIHHKVRSAGKKKDTSKGKKFTSSVSMMIVQIIAIDMVFSLDSILTAVGLTNHVGIMVVAVVLAMVFMLVFAKKVGEFINKHPSVIVLALSFLIMIGFLLILEAFHTEVEKNYVYFAMGFAFLVEMINLRASRRADEKEEAEMAARGDADDDENVQ